MLILDLCGGTGAWSQPYRDAGYRVEVVDLLHGQDVRLLQRTPARAHGILAAPACTHLAGSGARWWAEKGESALVAALGLVDACVRIAWVQHPVWWALENPVGRLSRYLGPPAMTFDPCDYGDPDTQRRALLWGSFTAPPEVSRCRDAGIEDAQAAAESLIAGGCGVRHQPGSRGRSTR